MTKNITKYKIGLVSGLVGFYIVWFGLHKWARKLTLGDSKAESAKIRLCYSQLISITAWYKQTFLITKKIENYAAS